MNLWLSAARAVTLLALASLAGCTHLGSTTEPATQHLVAEDDANRMDELRVRGLTQRLVVTPKQPGAPAYEIVPARQGQDPSTASRGTAGQRVWQVLVF